MLYWLDLSNTSMMGYRLSQLELSALSALRSLLGRVSSLRELHQNLHAEGKRRRYHSQTSSMFAGSQQVQETN